MVSCFHADFLTEVSLVRRFVLFRKTALSSNRASVFYFGLVTVRASMHCLLPRSVKALHHLGTCSKLLMAPILAL